MRTLEEKREYSRKYQAERRRDPEFVKKEKAYYRKWYAKNGRNRSVDYQEMIIEWMERYPEKVKARQKLNYAIKEGKIEKPQNCSKCNKITRLSAHHPDYTKPLEVKWLCSSCHKIVHLEMANGKILPRA